MLNKFLSYVLAEPALPRLPRLPQTLRTNYRFSSLAYRRSFDVRKRFGDSMGNDIKPSDPGENQGVRRFEVTVETAIPAIGTKNARPFLIYYLLWRARNDFLARSAL